MVFYRRIHWTHVKIQLHPVKRPIQVHRKQQPLHIERKNKNNNCWTNLQRKILQKITNHVPHIHLTTHTHTVRILFNQINRENIAHCQTSSQMTTHYYIECEQNSIQRIIGWKICNNRI